MSFVEGRLAEGFWSGQCSLPVCTELLCRLVVFAMEPRRNDVVPGEMTEARSALIFSVALLSSACKMGYDKLARPKYAGGLTEAGEALESLHHCPDRHAVAAPS